MRRFLAAALLLATSPALAAVRFVRPLDGSQLLGNATIEIETDAASVDRVEFYVDGVLVAVSRTPPYRTRFDFGDALASHRIVAYVDSNGYQKREAAEITSLPPTAGAAVDIDLVEVPLRLRARSPIAMADLSLRENGAPQTILELREQRSPAHFVFVIDRSLSMGDGKLDAALGGASSALRHLRPGDRASMVLFNHRVEASRPLTRDVAVELQRSVRPSGGTSLRDAIASVASTSERTVAILLSDGTDRNSLLAAADASTRIARSNVSLYALTFGPASRFVADSVAKSGGIARSTAAGSLGRDLDEIFADINSRYTVVYQSASRTKGWREIAVRPNRRGVDIVAAKRGYYAQ